MYGKYGSLVYLSFFLLCLIVYVALGDGAIRVSSLNVLVIAQEDEVENEPDVGEDSEATVDDESDSEDMKVWSVSIIYV